MYYVIVGEDCNNSSQKRRSVRPAHLERLKQLHAENRLLLAGPLFNEDEPNLLASGFKGEIIIAQFDNIEKAKAWAASDPYVTADVHTRISICPFKALTADDFNE